MLDAFHTLCKDSTLRTLSLEPENVLGDKSRIPTNVLAAEARTARPTWIGKNYQPGGILLMAKNPGGGSSSFITKRPGWDIEFFEALQELQRNPTSETYIRWRDHAQPRAMVQWPIWLSINAILEALQVGDLETVAIGNFMPFRTTGNTVRASEFFAAWTADTKAVIELTRPKLIVKMTAEFDRFSALCPRDTDWIPFSRANGDKYITQAGQDCLRQLREWRLSN